MKPHNLIIAPIVLIAVIFTLSILPMGRINGALKVRFPGLAQRLVEFRDTRDVRVTFSDVQNILHFPFYAIFAFFCLRYFSGRMRSFIRALSVTVLIVVGFSVLTELVQFFLPGRDASLTDLMIDAAGAIIGIAVFYGFQRLFPSRLCQRRQGNCLKKH